MIFTFEDNGITSLNGRTLLQCTLTLQKCGNDGLRSLEWRPRAVHVAQKAADHIITHRFNF